MVLAIFSLTIEGISILKSSGLTTKPVVISNFLLCSFTVTFVLTTFSFPLIVRVQTKSKLLILFNASLEKLTILPLKTAFGYVELSM